MGSHSMYDSGLTHTKVVAYIHGFIEILQNQAEHSAGERNFWKKEKDSVKFPDSRSVSLISIFSLF